MKSIIKLIFITILFPVLTLAQNEFNKKLTWNGNIIGEYLPNLYSNWNTTSVGGQVFLNYNFTDKWFSTLNGCVYFIPVTTNTIDYSALRSFAFVFSYDYDLLEKMSTILSTGVTYTNGKIALVKKEYAGLFAQIKSQYKVNDKIDLFLSISSIYDFNNQNITPSLKVGFKASFIIISFDITQFIKWDNPESRLNNTLSIPHITNHSY